MKLFCTVNQYIITDCQTFFGIDSSSERLAKLTSQFVTRYKITDNFLCKLSISASIAVIYKTVDISELCNLNVFVVVCLLSLFYGEIKKYIKSGRSLKMSVIILCVSTFLSTVYLVVSVPRCGMGLSDWVHLVQLSA